MILLWLGLNPKSKPDQEKLGTALQRLMAADPALAVRTAADGTTLLGAASDEHLDAAVNRLVHEFDVEADVTGIEVAYLEALTRSASGEAKYAKQYGGRGHYGHVKIRVEPGTHGSGFVFDNVIAGGAIPGEFVKPIAEGLREASDCGVLAGYPIADVHVTLCDGSYHDVDSSAEAFRIAAALAFVDAARKAEPILLEPIVSVFLAVPEEYVARAVAMLTARRGVLFPAPSQAGEWPTVAAEVPLCETFGINTELRERTAGRGICHVRFSRYAPAAQAGDEGDRDTPVRQPNSPRTPPHLLRAAVPEPADDVRDDDEVKALADRARAPRPR